MKASYLFWTICAFITALTAPLAMAETRVALVIGNSDYEHAPPLANPLNDAIDAAAAFKRIGFDEVVLAKNRTLSELTADFRSFSQLAREADVAVVYYAGHGVGVDGVSWLVPIDARLATSDDVAFETTPMNMALQAVEGARKLKLVVMDACRNSPFSRRMSAARGTRAVTRGLAPIEPPADSLVWYAARDGSEALDGSGRNSPFTQSLVRRISEPGVELDKVFRLIRDDVISSTGGEQEPFRYGSRGAEDFFFVSSTINPPSPIAPQSQPQYQPEPQLPAQAPAATSGALQASFSIQVRWRESGTVSDCRASAPAEDRALNFNSYRLQCGSSEAELTLLTSRDGDLRGIGKLSFDGEDVVLLGNGYRYVGRNKRISKAQVRVSFE